MGGEHACEKKELYRFVTFTFVWAHSFARFTFSKSLARGRFFAFPVKICLVYTVTQYG